MARGFQSMTPEKRSEISRMGNKKCRELGRAHKFKSGSDEAINAGRKGGLESARVRRLRAFKLGRTIPEHFS